MLYAGNDLDSVSTLKRVTYMQVHINSKMQRVLIRNNTESVMKHTNIPKH